MAGVDEGRTARSGVASAFFDEVHRRIGARDGTFHLVGTPIDIGDHLDGLAASTTRRVWSMSERSSLGALRRGHAQTTRSVSLGVDCRSLVSPIAVRVRLMSSFLRPDEAPCRIIPVPGSMLLADDVLLIAGRRGSHHNAEIWQTEDAGLVERAAAAYLRVWADATPLDDLAPLPPLDARTLAVALAMVDGDTDAEIAARLGIGQRTVQVTVRRIIDWCGARNRVHAVALMAGSDA